MTINMFEAPSPKPTPGPPAMRPEEFAAKWANVNFGERQASQEMFLDICAVAGHPTPVEHGDPETFTFEKRVPGGFADAFLDGCFGWEFKGSDDQLPGAFNQLLRYQVYLKTPPLLIVSSFNTIRIRTNFPGMETILHEIPVAGLAEPQNLAKLRNAFFAPDQFRPDQSVEDVTKETAALFRDIVTEMEQHNEDPERLARYLNQIVFCLYAEDAGLLPGNLFTQIVQQHYRNPVVFKRAVTDLFRQMSTGGMFGSDEIAHFNGDLFSAVDTVELSESAIFKLWEASKKNWQNIEPSIFGTLFERALDASKRSQLGAHYTAAADIMLVVEPVVMVPLRREWEEARQEVDNLLVEGDRDAARVRLDAFQDRLFLVTVLDPACGSGNFLYLALRCLLDLEKEVIDFAAGHGWDNLAPMVKPDQMLGLEINHYAVQLTRTSLWIGYLQWHYANGFPYRQIPILTRLVSIRQTDAILDLSDTANPREPEWPAAEFIIGNPPFLGRGGLRSALGDDYAKAAYKLYGGRIPNSSDLCCYWLELARKMVERKVTSRVGLLATQGIRGMANRTVLQRIKHTGEIFMAYPDRGWILDGAAVHISIICFDDGSESVREFDGSIIRGKINANLTVGADAGIAVRLAENAGIAFEGPSPKARFDITPGIAAQMLTAPLNVNGRPNSDVVRPVFNARDITQRPRDAYTIDFGVMGMDEASQYEMPFEHVKNHVYPKRLEKSQQPHRHRWWQYARPRPKMREAIQGLRRYIVKPRISKHPLFVWIDTATLCNDSNDVFARDDDYFFGVLHSFAHRIWALELGTQLETRPRYTPTTCFETFPFPEPTEEQREAIAEEARELDRLRQGWLNPPDMAESELKKRTLTNLYNARPSWLKMAHERLDAAVAGAYGWPANLPDAAILERLLELNLARAAAERVTVV